METFQWWLTWRPRAPLVLAALGISLLVFVPPSASAQNVDPDSNRQSELLFYSPVQVPPGKQYRVPFTTRSNFKNARIAGNLQAQGGSNNDIRILIIKGQSVVFDSGRRRSVVLSVDFSEAGQYVLIFDNTFSMVSAKTVSGTVSLVHSGIDVERNEADKEEDMAHFRKASSITGKLYAALKADENVWGTRQVLAMPAIRLNHSGALNAFSVPEANIIEVYRGLFRFADSTGDKSDDVLAGTLAHELSHIFYRHRFGSSGAGKGLFDELIGLTALDRTQEKEADLLGIRLVCQAGYDPNGMLILMLKFAQMNPRANSFMQNHPVGIERYRYLQAEVAACQNRQPDRHSNSEPEARPAGVQDGTALSGLYAILNTSMGTIIAKLFEMDAPNTVKNFVGLARGSTPWMDPATDSMVAKPLFVDITFHRTIPNLMIQTGDPTGTGSHTCGFTISDEIVPALRFDRPGRLAMANSGQPNTGACQFFITDAPYPSLDGSYTIFGQVVEGQDVVGRISHVPRDSRDKPLTPVKLIGVAISVPR